MTQRAAIVVPCYNEAQRLPADAFLDFLRTHPEIQFVFVDDGSTDQTLAVLHRLAAQHPAITVVPSPRNQGKAEAVRRGFLHLLDSPPPVIGFWDADLATPLRAIPQFLAFIDDRPSVDMVFGARVQLLGRSIRRKPLRHYLGRVFATQASLMLGLPIYDTQCGAKIFRSTPQLRAVFAEPFLTNWTFDVEIIARFLRLSPSGHALASSIYELPLDEWRDVEGSKVRPRDFLIALRDLWRIYFRYLR
jgi:dolichyl-phosphate beta-glucosyltransferase